MKTAVLPVTTRPAAAEEIAKQTRAADLLPLIWARDAAPVLDVEYIIKGIVAKGELLVVYGAPKSGKTFLTIDLSLAVASGLDWFGHRARAGLVIYIASEMGIRVMRRVRAWIDAKLGDTVEKWPAFVCVPIVVNLLYADDVANLYATIESLIAEHGAPAMVVIDTLARSMVGGDENSAQDMGRAVAVGDELRDRFKAATVVVHHSGKSATAGARGSSALLGAADTMLRVDLDDLGNRTAELEWCRDGESGARFGFKLAPVDLGTDADGDPVNTCIVVPTDASARAPARTRALSPAAANALRLLKMSLQDQGESLPATSVIPHGTRCVLVRVWRDACYRESPIEATDDAATRTRQLDARRNSFNRALEGLKAARIVGIAGDFAWLW